MTWETAVQLRSDKVIRMTADGRVKAVQSAICSPNSGHSTRPEDALPIEIG